MNIHSRQLRAAPLCNSSLGEIGEEAREEMSARAAEKLRELFDILQINHGNDHNTRETPQRVAKMLVEDLLVGRFTEPPHITEFDNANRYEQMIVTGPIEVRSTCAHHMMPIYGSAWVGVLPSADGKIVGLSKYDRIVDYFCRRMQIQEELVQQIGEYIVNKTSPRGLAVRISAVHMCKTHRGVRSSGRGRMVNAFYYGALQTEAALRNEFLNECHVLERSCPA